jgi:hypothetical protein
MGFCFAVVGGEMGRLYADSCITFLVSKSDWCEN